jgi:uncharacterized RDD family membrane protein YckC
MKQRWNDIIDWVVENSEQEPLIIAVVALALIAIAAVAMGVAVAVWSVFGFWSLAGAIPLTIVWIVLDEFWTQVKKKRQ